MRLKATLVLIAATTLILLGTIGAITD
jgi:hypothetical protein